MKNKIELNVREYLNEQKIRMILETLDSDNEKVREKAYSTWVEIIETNAGEIKPELMEKLISALKTYNH